MNIIHLFFLHKNLKSCLHTKSDVGCTNQCKRGFEGGWGMIDPLRSPFLCIPLLQPILHLPSQPLHPPSHFLEMRSKPTFKKPNLSIENICLFVILLPCFGMRLLSFCDPIPLLSFCNSFWFFTSGSLVFFSL